MGKTAWTAGFGRAEWGSAELAEGFESAGWGSAGRKMAFRRDGRQFPVGKRSSD